MGIEETSNKDLSTKSYPAKQLESPEVLGQVQGRPTVIIQPSTIINSSDNTLIDLQQTANNISIISNHIINNCTTKEDVKDVEYSSVTHIKLEYSQTLVINNTRVSMKLVSKIDINNLKNKSSVRLFKGRGDTYHPIEEKEAKNFNPVQDKYIILDINSDGTISAYADKKTSNALSEGRAKVIDKDNNYVEINDLNAVPNELIEQFYDVMKLVVNNYLLKLENEDNKERNSEEETIKSKHSHASYNPNYVSPVKARDRLDITEDDQEKERKLFNRNQQQLLSQILEAESVLESMYDKKVEEKKQLQKEMLQQEDLHQEQISEELHKSERTKPSEAA